MLWLSVNKQALAQDNSIECPGPEGSTRFESCVLQKETATAEAKLRRLLEERLKNHEAAVNLQKSQIAWEKFRDASCEWQQAEYGGINSIDAVRCVAKLTSEPVRYFEELP